MKSQVRQCLSKKKKRKQKKKKKGMSSVLLNKYSIMLKKKYNNDNSLFLGHSLRKSCKRPALLDKKPPPGRGNLVEFSQIEWLSENWWFYKNEKQSNLDTLAF